MFEKIPSDTRLIQQLLESGSEDEALRVIYKRNKGTVEQLIRKNGGSSEEAKDVFQESVIDLYENVRQGKFRGQSAINSYLYSIARFKWLNRLKRKKTEARIIDTQKFEQVEASFEQDYMEREKEEQVLKLFDSLGHSCRDLLIYALYYGYSMADIKKELNFNSEQVVRNQKYRCLKKLKNRLKAQPGLLNFLTPGP